MSPAQRRRSARRYNSRAAVFSNCLLAAGAAAFAMGGYAAWQGWRTLSWPQAQGEIVHSTLRQTSEERTVPMTDRLRGGLREAVRSGELDITYRYAIAGTAYDGHALEPWDLGLPSAAKVAEIAAAASSGRTQVRVTYDPLDARRSYLVPGPSQSSMALGLAGLVLAGIGFLMGRITRRA